MKEKKLSNMHSPRNNSQRLQEKNYLDRFNKLSVYSYIRDNKIYLGVKPEDVYELFFNVCGRVADKGICSVDQSALQYYMIIGLQDFYLPLQDENIVLKEELDKTQTMLMNLKKKNDEQFEIIMKHLEGFNHALLSRKPGQ